MIVIQTIPIRVPEIIHIFKCIPVFAFEFVLFVYPDVNTNSDHRVADNNTNRELYEYWSNKSPPTLPNPLHKVDT